MVVARYEQAELLSVDVLDETERGEGGFGHSGVK
jgi:dUTP pyrophosphatase